MSTKRACGVSYVKESESKQTGADGYSLLPGITI
jgi:hypothetical protein